MRSFQSFRSPPPSPYSFDLRPSCHVDVLISSFWEDSLERMILFLPSGPTRIRVSGNPPIDGFSRRLSLLSPRYSACDAFQRCHLLPPLSPKDPVFFQVDLSGERKERSPLLFPFFSERVLPFDRCNFFSRVFLGSVRTACEYSLPF